MKILQLVCLITPDNAYGGPVTVALNQCRALQAQGHEVLLVAGSRGFDSPPTEMGGVPVRLFPVRTLIPGSGFTGIWSPRMIRWLLKSLRGFDVIHLHMSRDLVTIPAARLSQALNKRVILQTHGMIVPSHNPLARPLDALLTRRLLRRASKVLFLTDVEAHGLKEVAGEDLPLEHLRNGIEVTSSSPRPTSSTTLSILFLARLQARKRPLAFVNSAKELTSGFPEASFLLVGPDEGEGHSVRDAIASSGQDQRIRWVGPATPNETHDYFQQADVYVLPSVNEPYPMSVLEAMAHGVPVIVTSSNGLAPHVADAGAGLVCSEDPADLTRCISAIMEDPTRRAIMAKNAHSLALHHFSMGPVVDDLLELYRA